MNLAAITTSTEIIGSALGIIGGWMVSGRHAPTRRRGFQIWLASDVFLVLLGALLHRWYFTAMMGYYAVTAVRGMINSGGES